MIFFFIHVNQRRSKAISLVSWDLLRRIERNRMAAKASRVSVHSWQPTWALATATAVPGLSLSLSFFFNHSKSFLLSHAPSPQQVSCGFGPITFPARLRLMEQPPSGTLTPSVPWQGKGTRWTTHRLWKLLLGGMRMHVHAHTHTLISLLIYNLHTRHLIKCTSHWFLVNL